MTSPIRTHRPKCVFAGYTFAQYKPWTTRRGGGDRCTCFEFEDGQRPNITPKVDYNRGLVVCVVEWRNWYDSGIRKGGDWYVFAWTTAPDKARWSTAAEEAGNASKARFYLANNASQVLTYVRESPAYFPPNGPNATRLCRCGSTEHWSSQHLVTPDTPRKETPMDTDALRREAARLLIEADKIDSRPKEPEGLRLKRKKAEPSANVIWWQMRFDVANGHRDGSGTRMYTYAAVRTSEGLWSTTGPQSPKSYTWDALITWIYDNMQDPVIYHVTELTVLD